VVNYLNWDLPVLHFPKQKDYILVIMFLYLNIQTVIYVFLPKIFLLSKITVA
jgi:hypothetical protein